MNAYTLAARETVREIRDSLSRQEPTREVIDYELERALSHIVVEWEGRTIFVGRPPQVFDDYEAIELWARLAADLAAMNQQRSECPDCGRAHGDHHNSCVQVKP